MTSDAELLALTLYMQESGGHAPAPAVLQLEMWKARVKKAEQALTVFERLKESRDGRL